MSNIETNEFLEILELIEAIRHKHDLDQWQDSQLMKASYAITILNCDIYGTIADESFVDIDNEIGELEENID